MVFIRPSVLRTAKASNGLTQDRYQYLRDQQEQSKLPWHLMLPSMPAPVSSELKNAPASAVPVTSPATQAPEAGKLPEATVTAKKEEPAPPAMINTPVVEAAPAPLNP
jgi:general secretion pathway protein D